MKFEIQLPEYKLAQGAEVSTAAVEAAMREAVTEAATLYANKVNAGEAAAETIEVTPKAQDGGATLFMIAATAFVTGLSAELGKEAAREIADLARRWIKHHKSALLAEVEDTPSRS